MLRRMLFPCLVLAACTSSPAPEVAPVGPSRLVVVHAQLLDDSAHDAILVEGDRIAAVGDGDELLLRAPDAMRIDAHGGLVLPGFHDSHIHMLGGGMTMVQVSLSEYTTLEDTVAAIGRWAKAHPEAAWILGRGWQYGIVPKGQFPTRQTLDAVVPDRPVFVRSYDGHSGWANSKALSLAGITADTPDPEDGRIVREADGKTPQGSLLEGAMDLVWKVLPEPNHATKLAALDKAVQHCLALGITSIDDITADLDSFALYSELEQQGRLPIRVTISPPVEGDLDAYLELRRRYNSPYVRFGFLKGFLDGVIESKTAYMVEPYAGTDDEVGKPLIPADRLYTLVKAAHAKGFQVALHAIGDGAVRMALDVYERVNKEMPGTGLRHRIEHIEVIHADDLPRFAANNVVASMMPFHANPFGEDAGGGVWSQNLGPERLKLSFPWRDLLDAQAHLAFGSDWPVMSADPLAGLAVATTRQDEDGKPEGGWNAHQAITLKEAVDAYTRGSAYAIGREGELGRLAPGQLADFVVLDPKVDPKNPLTFWKGERIREIVVGGVVRYPVKTTPPPQP